MPEDSYQVINGDSGGLNQNNVIFHLDQVNNLVNNGHAETVFQPLALSVMSATWQAAP